MNILLFDDHPAILDYLYNFFLAKDEVTRVFRTTDIDLFFKILKDNEIDIIISDVLTNDEEGLSKFEKLRPYKIPIIAYTSITSLYIHDILKEVGVSKVISKNESVEKIWEEIHLLLDQELGVDNVQTKNFSYLTLKERTIINQLAIGKIAKEISNECNIPINTLYKMTLNIYKKFEVTTTAQLIDKALKLGYIKM